MRIEGHNHPDLQQPTHPVAAPSAPSPGFAQSGSPSRCQQSPTPTHGSVKSSHGHRSAIYYQQQRQVLQCYEGKRTERKGLHTLVSVEGRKEALGTEDIFLLSGLCPFKQKNQKSGTSPLAIHSITTSCGVGDDDSFGSSLQKKRVIDRSHSASSRPAHDHPPAAHHSGTAEPPAAAARSQRRCSGSTCAGCPRVATGSSPTVRQPQRVTSRQPAPWGSSPPAARLPVSTGEFSLSHPAIYFNGFLHRISCGVAIEK